jgi:hypothetical protein
MLFYKILREVYMIKKRHLKLFTCLALASVMSFSNISNSVHAYTTELSINVVKQAKTNWCWAATAEMAGGRIYGNSNRTQTDVVSHVKGSSLPNNAGTLAEGKDGSEYMCYDSSLFTFKYSNTPFTITQIRTAINSAYPIQASIGYYSGSTRTGGHRVVICGVDSSESRLQYINPWDGTSHWVTLATFKTGLLATGSKYDGTLFLDGPDTSSIAYSGGSITDAGGYSDITSLKAENTSEVQNTTGIVTVDIPDSTENIDLDMETANNSKEKSSVTDFVKSSTNDIYKYTNKTAKTVKLDDAIKLYYLSPVDLIESYKLGSSFDSLISDKFVWKAPIEDVNNNITYETSISSESLNSNKWNLEDVGEVDLTNNISYQYNKAEIESLLKNQGFDKAENLKFVNTGRYHINILYFTQDNQEYGIAVNTRPDLINLSNGTVYTMDEIINTLDTAFNNADN